MSAGRRRHVQRSGRGRVHGLIEARGGAIPRLLLAAGLHRLSFSPRVDRGRGRSVLFRLPYVVICAQVVWQERIWAAVVVAVSSRLRLALAVIAAVFVVLQLPPQLLVQSWAGVGRLCVCLDGAHRWLVLDVVQVLDTGFNWHRYASVWTHQRSWAVCKMSRVQR